MPLTESRALCVLVVAVLLTFANTLFGGFVWDDELFFLDNAYMASWTHVPRFFDESLVAGVGLDHNLYRPLQLLTHFVDLRLWGEHAWGHHLTNLALQATAAALGFRVLLAFLGRRDADSVTAALLAALVYFLHPLQTFAVAYLSGRGDTLVLVFGFASLLLFRAHFAASAACALAALLSKESGVVVAPLILAWDWLARTRGEVPRMAVARHAVLFGLVAAYAVLRLTALDFQDDFAIVGPRGVFADDFGTRLLTYLSTLPHGLRLILAPVDLHHARSFPLAHSPLQPSVLLGAAIVLAVSIRLVRRRHHPGPELLGLAWALCATIPTSNLLVRIAATCYDHWFLVPAFGLAVALAAPLAQRATPPLRWAIAGLALLAGLVSFVDNRVWRDPGTFYRHVLRYEPDSAPMLQNLAMQLTAEGDTEQAMALYRRAIEAGDFAPEPHYNLALLHLQRREIELARRELERALELDERFALAHQSLGEIAIHEGRLDEAARHLERAVAIRPLPKSHAYLAEIRERQGDHARARYHREQAARYRRPSP